MKGLATIGLFYKSLHILKCDAFGTTINLQHYAIDLHLNLIFGKLRSYMKIGAYAMQDRMERLHRCMQ
jgi:hypothetical protein